MALVSIVVNLLLIGYALECCQGRCSRSNDLWVSPTCDGAVHDVDDSFVRMVPKRRILSSGKIGCAQHSVVLCQIPDCLSSPCFHGNCTETLNGYICQCHDGWTGDLCDIEAPMSMPNKSDPTETHPYHTASSPTNMDSTTPATTAMERMTTPELSATDASLTSAGQEKVTFSQVASTTEGGSGNGRQREESSSPGSSTVSPETTDANTDISTNASTPEVFTTASDHEKTTASQFTSTTEKTVRHTEESFLSASPEGYPDTTLPTTERARPTTHSSSREPTHNTSPAQSSSSQTVTSQETPVLYKTSVSPSPSTKGLTPMTTMASLQTEFCSPSPVTSCPVDWITKRDGINKCYKLDTMTSNWHALNEVCCDVSATMLVIDSLLENEFIENTFGSSADSINIWLGCHNIDGDNDLWSCVNSTSAWIDVNKDQTGYWRWKYGRPNATATGSRCAYSELSDDGMWVDTDCQESFRVICQMTLIPDQSTSPNEESEEDDR